MRRVISWAVFLVTIAGMYVWAAPTSLGGSTSYVIVDGSSMEPTYRHGDLVIAREQDEYTIGDSVVYDAPIGRRFNVIHRIIAPTEGGFITQGDNREEPDGWVAPHETIHGAARFHIPNGGALIAVLRQPAVIVGLLSGFLAFEFLKRREQGRVTSAGVDASEQSLEREAETTR
jgi:signal peptidase I